MKKERLIYDFLTLILIALVVGVLIQNFAGPAQMSFDNAYSSIYMSFKLIGILYLYSLAYTIGLIVLIARKEKGAVNIVTMILGSLILPGLAPFVYYLLYLRKKI